MKRVGNNKNLESRARVKQDTDEITADGHKHGKSVGKTSCSVEREHKRVWGMSRRYSGGLRNTKSVWVAETKGDEDRNGSNNERVVS